MPMWASKETFLTLSQEAQEGRFFEVNVKEIDLTYSPNKLDATSKNSYHMGSKSRTVEICCMLESPEALK